VLISVTGIIAFYPTAIRFTGVPNFSATAISSANVAPRRSSGAFASSRASVADLQWQEALDAHSEWFRRDGRASPSRTPPVPGLLNTCPFSTYFSEQMPAIMRESTRATTSTAYSRTPGRRSPICRMPLRAVPRRARDRHAGISRTPPAAHRRTVETHTAIAREKHPTIFLRQPRWGMAPRPICTRSRRTACGSTATIRAAMPRTRRRGVARNKAASRARDEGPHDHERRVRMRPARSGGATREESRRGHVVDGADVERDARVVSLARARKPASAKITAAESRRDFFQWQAPRSAFHVSAADRESRRGLGARPQRPLRGARASGPRDAAPAILAGLFPCCWRAASCSTSCTKRK